MISAPVNKKISYARKRLQGYETWLQNCSRKPWRTRAVGRLRISGSIIIKSICELCNVRIWTPLIWQRGYWSLGILVCFCVSCYLLVKYWSLTCHKWEGVIYCVAGGQLRPRWGNGLWSCLCVRLFDWLVGLFLVLWFKNSIFYNVGHSKDQKVLTLQFSLYVYQREYITSR